MGRSDRARSAECTSRNRVEGFALWASLLSAIGLFRRRFGWPWNPSIEADFLQCSYGFRPNRCTMDAIDHARWYMQESLKYFWIIEGDISSYFDAINHRKLMKLLGRRVKDGRLLDLIWGFLRAGVMERKLFKDTDTGTPQGGIVSPLLANVYLHEFDKFMKRYTDLPERVKHQRRKDGLGNIAYVRYADDFIVLSNGTKDQAYTLRDELQRFLSEELRLTLSMEKTKVTHLNEGFVFLGFQMKRGPAMNGGMTTRVLIPSKAIKKHLGGAQSRLLPVDPRGLGVAEAPGGQQGHLGMVPLLPVHESGHDAIRPGPTRGLLAGGPLACRQVQLSCKSAIMPVPPRFDIGDDRGTTGDALRLQDATVSAPPSSFPEPVYQQRGPDPGETTRGTGPADHREQERFGGSASRDHGPRQLHLSMAGMRREVTLGTGHVDHIRPRCVFGWKPDADKPENLWTLCLEHHMIKTENDRQRESRVH